MATPQQPKPEIEVISPEGVEERLVDELAFRITMTGGGKYRVYVKNEPHMPWASIIVKDTEMAATQEMGKLMRLTGALHQDPVGTLARILGVEGKKE